MVLDIKVEGDRQHSLSEEGAFVRQEIVSSLDGDDKGIYIGLIVDLGDLELSFRDVNQPLVNLLSRDNGYSGGTGGKKHGRSRIERGQVSIWMLLCTRERLATGVAKSERSEEEGQCGKERSGLGN